MATTTTTTTKATIPSNKSPSRLQTTTTARRRRRRRHPSPSYNNLTRMDVTMLSSHSRLSSARQDDLMTRQQEEQQRRRRRRRRRQKPHPLSHSETDGPYRQSHGAMISSSIFVVIVVAVCLFCVTTDPTFSTTRTDGSCGFVQAFLHSANPSRTSLPSSKFWNDNERRVSNNSGLVPLRASTLDRTETAKVTTDKSKSKPTSSTTGGSTSASGSYYNMKRNGSRPSVSKANGVKITTAVDDIATATVGSSNDNNKNNRNGRSVSTSTSTSPSPLPVVTTYDDSTSTKSQSTTTSTSSSSSSSSSTSYSSSSEDNNIDIDDDDDPINGVVGRWENLKGNWVLRPPNLVDEPPRAVLHVLGGALVGAAPHITYRYVLERLAEEGFLVVATPYKLSFNHLATCDEVLTKFENLAPMLAREYGALPVVGIGHSCGALLQLLITCLFPDTPRAANALISFNNKPVTEAVPFFEEIFAPAFTSLATSPPPISSVSESTSSSQQQSPPPPTSNDSLKVGLKLAKAATRGEIPSDQLLMEAAQVAGIHAPQFFRTIFPFTPATMMMNFQQQQRQQQKQQQPPVQIKIPTEIREAYKTWAGPSVTALSDAGVLPLLHQTVTSLEQIPQLVDEVADGARDFNPTPALVRAAAGKAYRARRTLVLGYDDDSIDESDEVEEVLREARSITRMRRPMVPIDVERVTLTGGHVTPLTAPPLDVAVKTEDLLGIETSRERLGYDQAEATVQRLLQWLDEGNL